MVFRLILHPIYLRENTFFGLPLQLAKTSIKLLQKKKYNHSQHIWRLIAYIMEISDLKLFGTEAALQRCSYKEVFWKYAVNLQENTHAEVRFQ